MYNLDHERVGTKSGTTVKAHSLWMIEAACMQPKATNGSRPSAISSEIHEVTPGSPSNRLLFQTEESQLALPLFAEVEFEQSNLSRAIAQNVYMYKRIGKNFM